MGLRETFAMRIKALREKKGLSCVQLAKELGVSSASLGYYERKERVPDIEVLNMFCKYYNVSADYLMGLSDVASLDIEKQKVANYLGLSEKAVDEIKKQTDNFLSKAISCDFLEYHFENIVDLLFKVSNSSRTEFELFNFDGFKLKSTGDKINDLKQVKNFIDEIFSQTEYYRYKFVQYAESINDSFDARTYMHFALKQEEDGIALKVEEEDNGKHNET